MNTFERSLSNHFGEEALKKIQAVRVGIAGLGGLGSNCAAALVRCGFKHFTLCDFDIVDISNLNRQWYFLDQLGLAKTEALKANLLKVNPGLSFVLIQERITDLNAKQIFSRCDCVVEAFDKADSKQMLMRTFWDSDKFFVSASGLAGWQEPDSIVTRNLKANIVLVGDNRSEVSNSMPACAPRVSVAAAKQANAVLLWALS